MSLRTILPETRASGQAVYISQIRSLHGDPRTLIVGAVGTTTACLVTAYETWDIKFLACALALAGISLLRAFEMSAFRSWVMDCTDLTRLRTWDNLYVTASAAYVFVMGLWCFLAFASTPLPMVQLLSFSMTLVNMIGVAARNYGSNRLVIAQLTSAGVPMIVGLFWIGDASYAICACVLGPFFLSFKTVADHLRTTLAREALSTTAAQFLAQRLDTALNNMSHGLCMIDAHGVISIANAQLPAILGIDPVALRPGNRLKDVALACARAGVVSPRELRDAFALPRAGSSRTRREVTVGVQGGKVLTLTSQTLEDGGHVFVVEDVTERTKAVARINQLAKYDPLTGLPNRTFFRDQLDDLLRSTGHEQAVHFIDLDGFKLVNDTLGHPCGDELLKRVAGRLQSLLGRADLIARFGGDEFVLVQPVQRDRGQASSYARAIVEELGRPYELDGHSVVVGASVGIAVFPTDGGSADTLLKNADMALYQAKADGRGKWRFFETEMDRQAKAQRLLEMDFRTAVLNEALTVYFQPILNLRTGRVQSCEALLRWFDPVRGEVSPAEFIPVAEEVGLIGRVGAWVLKAACEEAVRWPNDTRVAVNLSALQFRDSDIVEEVKSALEYSHLAATRLELEITESVILQDSTGILDTLQRLKSMGIRISLDDFGTGFSSLSYLRKFPFDKIKLDRSFLQNIAKDKNITLLTGISRLCGDLGFDLVLEGVETQDQLDVALSIDEINEVQGFLFSRPSPAERMRELLRVQAPPELTRQASLSGAHG